MTQATQITTFTAGKLKIKTYESRCDMGAEAASDVAVKSGNYFCQSKDV